MKLFYRVLIHLLTGIVVVLSGWAVCFYFAIVDEINDEIDDSLEDYSELIIIRSLAGKELPSSDSGSNNQYFLREVTDAYVRTRDRIRYQDTMVYIVEKKETEPARILTTIFRNDAGQYYELSVSTPTIEKQDLRESIFYLLIGLFVILLVTILIINIWVFYRSMKPFYVLLHWLGDYRLGQTHKPLYNPTHTSEFQKLNDTVIRFAQHSEEVFQQQKQFIGNASHEIQTPLAVCRNRLEMLMEDETLTEQQLGEIIKTYETLEYVSKLNKSLLLLSKIDNHQYSETSKVCLNDVLHSLIPDFEEVYAFKEVSLSLEENARLCADMNEVLATVLMTNLLKNAFVHNVEGGSIRITINRDSICFSNTGTLVALDEKRVFERFYQGNKKEGSTGLGLAISNAVCRQFNLELKYVFKDGMHQFWVHCH
jgi:signal transduction histidine kinase